MKQLYTFLIACLLHPLLASAQTETHNPPAETDAHEGKETVFAPQKDSLQMALPSPVPQARIFSPFGMYGITPFDHGFATWQLHKGFNASLGLNLTFSPSRYAPPGAGFGQEAAFMYAFPLNNRISVAGGLYASNMDWGFLHSRNVGIAAIAAFQLTERISIYAYGNKSFMPQRAPYYYPLSNYIPDRLGGMVNFKLGESSAISVGIEGRKYDYPW